MQAGLVAASTPTPTARTARPHIDGVTMAVMLPCACSTAKSRAMAASATSLRPPAMLDSTTTIISSQPAAAEPGGRRGWRQRCQQWLGKTSTASGRTNMHGIS